MSKLSVQRVCQVPECRDCTSIGENLSLLAAALSPVDREQWREAGLLARAYTVLKVGSYSIYTCIQYLHISSIYIYISTYLHWPGTGGPPVPADHPSG